MSFSVLFNYHNSTTEIMNVQILNGWIFFKPSLPMSVFYFILLGLVSDGTCILEATKRSYWVRQVNCKKMLLLPSLVKVKRISFCSWDMIRYTYLYVFWEQSSFFVLPVMWIVVYNSSNSLEFWPKVMYQKYSMLNRATFANLSGSDKELHQPVTQYSDQFESHNLMTLSAIQIFCLF